MSIKSFFSSPHTQAVRNDVRNLAQDTVIAAQKQVVEPATAAAREALNTASDKARGAIENARSFVGQKATDAEKLASAQWDHASKWITKNPFSAMGIAFGAGLVFSAISGIAGSRR